MKKELLLSVLMFLIGTQFAANAQELTVSDISCRLLTYTQTIDDVIALYREGNGIRVQLAPYRCNPFMTGFDITPTINRGNNGAPDSVSVNVVPVVSEPYKNANVLQQCYSVSFIIHGMEANSFYFSCLWFKGQVSLTTESKSLMLKDPGVEVTVDDVIYHIYEMRQFAVLSNGKNAKGELTIPRELSYNGKNYPVKAIKSQAFTGCSTLTAVTIPESVIAIEKEAFKNCSNLSAINNGANVEMVSYNAFGGTPWFNNQPDGVVYFGKALCACKGNLPEGTDLIIKEGTMSITPGTFKFCKGLSSVTIPEGITNIESCTFMGCSDLVSVKLPESLTIIGLEAFQECSKITSIHLPSHIKYICSNAFRYCTSLTSINIPEGVESIDDNAFFYCINMTAITLPESLKKIGRDAFRNCKSLSDIKTPDNVEEISYGAFLGCTKLNSITLSGNLKFIGEGAFQYCSDLSTIVCNAQIPPIEIPNPDKSYYYPGDAFYQVNKQNCKLYVPQGCVEAYRAAELWKDFENIVATASDIQHSGCLSRTRASSKSTTQSISLLKEGNILTVNLRNYWSTCDTQDFEVTPSVSDGNNSDPYTVSVRVKPIGEDIADCICPYNISFTIHDVEANSFQFKCWWFNGQVNLTEGEPWVMSNEYYPEGTKWTEIRLDTLKYDSWYSKVDDEWVPNFETVEYSVKGEYTPKYWEVPLKCVYTNSQECTDSLALLIYEGRDYGYDMGVLATVPLLFDDNTTPYPGEAYFFDWGVGMTLRFVDILSNNTTAIYPPGTFDFGIIEEIKEGNFGGVRPLKYTDVNGVRIIQGIGVTTWNDGECVFGPVKPYRALSFFNEDFPHKERHYRSMLVHFERNGEVLYNVWPGTPDDMVTFTEGQMATIILPTTPDASKGKYYRLDRREDDKVIFEEELHPQAHVPYIIVPKEDFFIDLSTLDLAGLSQDTVSIQGIRFIGSYKSEKVDEQEGFYIDIIDTTPDCSLSSSGETGRGAFLIGALRAYLSWNDPYSQGPTKGRTEKLGIVLHDNGTDISEMKNDRVKSEKYDAIYDLQGRKINSQFSILNSQLPKGLYIVNGKKVVK